MKRLMIRLMILVAAATCCTAHAWADTVAGEEDTVLVTWRDLRITRGDYEAALRAIPEQDRFEFQLDMRRITQLLNGLLLSRTMAAEGRQLGLDKDPLTQKEMAQAADRVLADRRLEAFEKSLKIPDLTAVAEERYRIKPEEFREPEQVRASHVLVDTKTRSDDEALARAEEVRSKALAGADFAVLADEFSDDPSAKSNGGDLGFFVRGRMAKPFEDAAFALEKPGAISPVVKTQFGYHVIVLREKRPARQKPFAEVKGELIKPLTKRYVETEKSRYVTSIGTDKSIVLNTAAIDKLKQDAPPIPRIPDHIETPAAWEFTAPTPGK
jgi:peptidyl-prolyl cis-trans isomerase C